MLMVWDEPKRAANVEKHGLDFADARDRFEWKTAIVAPSYRGEGGPPRFKALGYLDGRLVGLVFSLLGEEAVSAVSLRPANRSERTRYAESAR